MMQAFNFGIRKSFADSGEDARSRYHVPSSIYSGPGPAEEDAPARTSGYTAHGMRNPYEEHQPRYNPLNQAHPRGSCLLNTNDPVVMHLLTETAIGDSKEYEILSFEEVEQLKKEKMLLDNRVEATRRKLALENKLRDAAQSLNRLYSTKGRSGSGQSMPDDPSKSPRRQRRSLLGSRSSNGEALSRADDEFAASSRKVEELTQELARLEKRLDETQRRILEHTAGILQMTHKGLKKNIRKQELPRSPESMSSANRRSVSAVDGIDDFDERSLYRVPDYVTDFGAPHSGIGNRQVVEDTVLEAAEIRLLDLSRRLHEMLLQTDPDERVDLPPERGSGGGGSKPGDQIQAHLGYLATGLGAMEAAQAKTIAEAQKSIFDSEDQLEDVNVRLHDMLEKTNSIGQVAAPMPAESRGKSMQSQLAFSTMVLDRLDERIELLMEQKDILSRQIQQQRELNSKSDSQRDAQILDLTTQLQESKRLQHLGEEEAHTTRDQIDMLMEQLDRAKQENVLTQQQQGTAQNKALQAEQDMRREADFRSLQEQHAQLQEDFARSQSDFDLQSQRHLQQVNDLSKSNADRDIELQKQHAQLQAEFARSQSDFDLQSQRHLQQVNDLSKSNADRDIELQKHRDMVEQSTSQLNELMKANETVQSDLRQAREQLQSHAQQTATSDAELEKMKAEMMQRESEVVRAQTELTMVKAELDGAYGTRAQRAADVSKNPAVQKEIDDLNDKNSELQRQLDFLQSQHETKGVGSAELKNEVNALQKELKDTIEDYELMTKASIEFEKERDQLEATIDRIRERCESLETQLNDEKVKWIGVRSDAPTETTSTSVLKNEFKKMMRDTRAENVKALRAEQEERRRLENIIRSMKKEQHQIPIKSNLSQNKVAE